MLSDIYTYDINRAEFRRKFKPDLGVWMAYGVETGGVYAVELCTHAATLSEHAYRAFASRETIERVTYLEARDELEAFMKARKMEADK